MAVRLNVDPRDAVPIWRQIEEGVRQLVAAGALARGAVVPSVRELSRQLRVNPATVVKAYQRLTDAGVLQVRRGEGTFVAAAPPTMPRGERQRALRVAALRFASFAATLGIPVEEALAEVEAVWMRLSEKVERGGGR
jgi:GntR family transcriptional regulator